MSAASPSSNVDSAASAARPEPHWWGRLAGWALTAIVLVYAIWFFGFATRQDDPVAALPLHALRSDAPFTTRPDVRAAMIDRLNGEPARTSLRTGLDEPVLWLLVSIPAGAGDRTLHLPEKNVRRADAVLLDDGRIIQRAHFGIGLDPVGARRALPGYAIDVPQQVDGERIEGPLTLLMRLEPHGLTQTIAIHAWTAADFVDRQIRSQQRSTMLVGALLLLAIYAVAAAQAGRVAYLLAFAFWLVARCGYVMGVSGFFHATIGAPLGSPLGAALFKSAMLSFACAAAILTWSLTRDELRGTAAHQALRRVMIGSCWLTGLVALAPLPVYHVALWLVSGAVIVAAVALILTQFHRLTSAATRIFLAVTLVDAAAATNELLHAMALIQSPLPWFTLQEISPLSALLVGVAVGSNVARERARRLEVQSAAITALGKYESVYRTVPIGLISIGSGDRVERYNAGFARLFGLPAAAEEAGPALDRCFPAALRERIRGALAVEGECDFPFQLHGGAPRWLRIMARGTPAAFEASVTDITEHKNVERRLAQAAEHDTLTGALNRRGLSRRIERLLAGAHDPTRLSIGYIDLDRFKLLNDLYGHAAGDLVLRDVVVRLQQALGPRVAIARLGGDEFALLFPESVTSTASTTTADGLPDHEALARRALDAIAGCPFEIPPQSFAVTASVGLFRVAAGLSHEDLINGADRACREAKRKGRNQVVMLDDSAVALQRQQAELAVLSRLRDRREFEDLALAVQPILSLDDSSRLGGEVLLRRRGDDGRLLPPGGLLEAAERRGEITQIDRWVVQSALEWLDQHAIRLGRLEFLSLNLSANSLNDELFKTFVVATLRKFHAVAPLVLIEIKESVAMQDVFMMEKFISAVRETGARIALDDFGSGYSNFASLSDVGASYLKIDGSFVKRLTEHESGTAIIRTMTVLAHELGMECVAGWVEDTATLALLKQLGVDYGQGIALSPPLPVGEFEALCEHGEAALQPELRRVLGLSKAATAADLRRQLARIAPLV
ncbi:MAG: putative bifunctional diguanylate cyclase/phosphodiesterase [Lautropia sp.]